MSLRFTATLAFLLMVTLLVGCTGVPAVTPPAETPPVSAAPSAAPETPGPWDEYLEEVCKTYMDVDLKQAYRRFDFEIFWTFHTNFYQPFTQDPNIDPQMRLGCLRFYWRDNSASIKEDRTFIGTLNSALVTECIIVGNVLTESITTTIRSSAGMRSANDPSLPHRISTFSENAHVECPLDINASLLEISNTQGFTDDLMLLPLQADRDAVLNAVPVMLGDAADHYSEFMMAVAIENLSRETNSILFYEPHIDSSLSPAPLSSADTFTYETELAIVHDTSNDDIPLLYATQLGGWQTDSSVSADGEQCMGQTGQHYLFESFGRCELGDADDCPGTAQVHYLQFLTMDPAGNLSRCRIEPGAIAIDNVPFWAGPATLYIGHNPTTGENLLDPIIIYEAWVDPDSSTKPGEG